MSKDSSHKKQKVRIVFIGDLANQHPVDEFKPHHVLNKRPLDF